MSLGDAEAGRGSCVASSGKLRCADWPLMVSAATSWARAAISAVGNVPSQILDFFLGSRISDTHFPQLRIRTPRYTGCSPSLLLFLASPPPPPPPAVVSTTLLDPPLEASCIFFEPWPSSDEALGQEEVMEDKEEEEEEEVIVEKDELALQSWMSCSSMVRSQWCGVFELEGNLKWLHK
ncbi:hypothetical protein MUK42_11320 [Musa troglodytarum]|uniref:Uncharacterized protein n=1 Tax=Musa troglodytarum TaxID=320322 RepID=A0A9E7FTD7_9LILI|nr:hypothetical protein MUK42_11320 [Musa troglodytarum]